MVPPEFIRYFKALVEHDPRAEHWKDWWPAHEAEAAAQLDPGVYLRLKYGSYKEIFDILEDEGHSYPRPMRYWHRKLRFPNSVPTTWLKEKIMMADLEERLPVELRETDLSAIMESLEPGDEVWTYSSPSRTWEAMMGSAGFAFVRGGVPYDSIETTCC